MKPDEITLSLASSPPTLAPHCVRCSAGGVASGVSELMGWWEAEEK
jgi:hypothetical protein